MRVMRCYGCHMVTEVPERIGQLAALFGTELLCENCGDGRSPVPEHVQRVALAGKRAPRVEVGHPWERER